MAKKVCLINFKGGVGKTTLAFHLAAHLAKRHRVLVIDVDHQSSLSIVLMGPALWERVSNDNRTCNAIFQSYCNRKVKMPGPEIIVKNPLHQRAPQYNFYPKLDLVPAQFELDDTEIELASTTVGSATVSEWQKRTLLAEWLDAVNAENDYDYILFDCPPATKLVSQNVLAASDYYLIPVIPDVMSSRGVTHFRELVDRIDKKLEFWRHAAGIPKGEVPDSYVPKIEMAGIVAYMAKHAGNAASGFTNVHTEQLATLRRLWGAQMLPTVVKHMTGISEAMDAGWPIWNLQATQNTSRVSPSMTQACADIDARIS